jgi:hypothetical protein
MFSACDTEYVIGRLIFHLGFLSEKRGGFDASDYSLEHLPVLRACLT